MAKKVRKIWRYIRKKKIPVYAAYSGYFIMLSVFPMLVLFLCLLRYTDHHRTPCESPDG